ncbi:MAG: hypothetical protein GX556_10735 [Fibrobacter sp.]|nr:hypothetical protein [Fibrobacter sp.]
MFLAASLQMLFSCTAVNNSRTIGKGNTGVELSLGGPLMTNLGVAMPIPNLYLGGRFGVREDLDISGHLNLTSPIIPGIALDLITSAHWVPFQPGTGNQSATPDRGWSSGLGLDIQWVTDFKGGLVVLPSIDLSGSHRYRWLSTFAGSAFGLNFYRPGDESILQISPFLGFEFITRKNLSFCIKFTAYDLLFNYDGSQVYWVYLKENTPARQKYAPLGISIGASYVFTRRAQD